MDLLKKISIFVFLLCVLIALKNQRAETDAPSVLNLDDPSWREIEEEEAQSDAGFRELQYDFYRESCPSAESIIRLTFRELYALNNTIAPQLLRLSFHDCFVMSCNVGLLRTCRIQQIYQLGDSLSDVGNLIRELPVGAATPFARLPYGSNFPMGPTGRASNRNLMIDYFAMDAGLPLLPPFKNSDVDFSHGVNFAVGGSTALPWNVLAAMNISTPITTNSLSVQLDWMSAYFNSIYHNQRDCDGKFENALFMLGPFGGSDYHNALFQGKPVHEIKATLLPKVVDEIMAAVRRLIDLGAKKVVVPGIYTIFQLPIYRTAFYGNFEMWDAGEDLAIYHSVALRQAIDNLNQQEKPDAVVVYGDYWSAYQSLDLYSVGVMDLKVCCGSGGGRYNMDLGRMCGTEGVSGCQDPNKHISWDGINLTEKAYWFMTKYMLHHIFRDLHCPSPL